MGRDLKRKVEVAEEYLNLTEITHAGKKVL